MGVEVESSRSVRAARVRMKALEQRREPFDARVAVRAEHTASG